MILDAHVHFLDPRRFRYAWMEERSRLARTFLPQQLLRAMQPVGVSRVVAVEAHNSPDEAQWLLALARRHRWIAGVVAHVDLCSPRLGWELDALMRGKLVGIRHQVEAEPDPEWLTRPQVIAGLREVARRGLPFDLVIFPRHFPVVQALADRLPNLRLSLDHLGKPPIAAGDLEPWASGLRLLAAIPQLCAKLSGLLTQASQPRWSVDQLRPYVQEAWQMFGAERLMWGSDWPVCRRAARYPMTLQVVLAAVGQPDRAQLEALLGGTARRCYRLD